MIAAKFVTPKTCKVSYKDQFPSSCMTEMAHCLRARVGLFFVFCLKKLGQSKGINEKASSPSMSLCPDIKIRDHCDVVVMFLLYFLPTYVRIIAQNSITRHKPFKHLSHHLKSKQTVA